MESAVFGPLMGYGCPDRAALLIGQWAKTDPNFRKWAAYMDIDRQTDRLCFTYRTVHFTLSAALLRDGAALGY
jgi:hypothetical protein